MILPSELKIGLKVQNVPEKGWLALVSKNRPKRDRYQLQISPPPTSPKGAVKRLVSEV